MSVSDVMIAIHCENLPGLCFQDRTALRLGVQRGKEVIDDVPGDLPTVIFTVPLHVALNGSGSQPNFTGPFAHGTPQERFVYLCWGERRDGEWETLRRAKILLGAISIEAVEAAIKEERPIAAYVDMTDKKGGPICASVKGSHIRWEDPTESTVTT